MPSTRTQQASNDLDRLASIPRVAREGERAEYVAERQLLENAQAKFLTEIPTRFTEAFTRSLSGVETMAGVSSEYIALHWNNELGERDLETNPEYALYMAFEAGLAWLSTRIDSIGEDIAAIDYTNTLESGFDGD